MDRNEQNVSWRLPRAVSALVVLATLGFVAPFASPALAGEGARTGAADDARADIADLRREVEELRRRDEEQRARVGELERLLREVIEARGAGDADAPARAVDASAATGATPAAVVPAVSDLDRALEAAGATSPAAASASDSATRSADVWAGPPGGPVQARLVDVSLSTMIAGGGSSVDNAEISNLQGGSHDPGRNGFTLQQLELSLTGAVDPYFTGEAHILAGDHGVELEEAFFTTSALPWGLQVEAGYFLTEFGLINPLHAHAWDWMDQPVAITRMFGGEGMRSPGLRLGWLMPTPFFSELHVGVQNADEGSLTPSFLGSGGIGGRPNVDRDVDGLDDFLWLARWNGAWDLTPEAALLLGVSGLSGPNGTGGDGRTWIYGADWKLRWRSKNSFRGWPFFLWQGEVLKRDYTADWFIAGTESGGGGGGGGHDGHDHGGEEEEEAEFPEDLPADILRDIGLYTQLLYGFRHGWALGLRYEYATGRGQSVFEGLPDSRRGDPLRDDRHRLSPLLVWHPTHFSRLRLQYNWDHADHLGGGGGGSAHTLWIGGEVFYGTHPAHKY